MKKKLVSMVLGSFLVLGGAAGVSAQTDDDRDCGEFSSTQEVMAFWYENGYSATNDPHGLDGDGDGLPCEVPQSEYDQYVASQQGTPPADGNDEQESNEEAVGEPLPDTATNNPLMMILGAGLAGAGSLLLFRRKKKEAEV